MSSSCPRCGWSQVDGARCPRCGVEVERYRADAAAAASVVTAPAVPASSIAPERTAVAAARPAGFWSRAVAALIDAAVVVTAETFLTFFLWTMTEDRLLGVTWRGFRFLVGSGYFVVMHWLHGQTLGKMVVGVRVVSLDGGPLSLGQSVLRYFGTWVSACLLGVGYLVAGIRTDKRALHDLIASTRVEHVA